MKKEDFTDNIINSLNGIIIAVPSDALFSKIEQKIASTNKISNKNIGLIAASIVFVFSLNIVLLIGSSNVNKSEMASLERVINNNNQLYK